MKITLGREVLTLVINAAKLVSMLTGGTSADGVSLARDADGLDDHHCLVSIELPVTIKRRGNELRLVIQGDTLPPAADPNWSTSSRGRISVSSVWCVPWMPTSKTCANRLGVHRADIGRILLLAFLAPTIVGQILMGRQPDTMSALKRSQLSRSDLP